MKTEIEVLFPSKFKKILLIDGINENILLESLDINKNRNMIFRAGEGSGNSGSFFFFS